MDVIVYKEGKKERRRKEAGAFPVEYLKVVVSSSSRNNNLYPDCLSTLEVGGIKWNWGKRNGDGARESESAFTWPFPTDWTTLFLTPIWNSTECPQRLSLFQSAAGKQRSRGIFHGERWLTAIYGLHTCSWMSTYAISFWSLLGLHSHMKYIIHTFITLPYCKIQSIKRVAVYFGETAVWYWMY